MPRSAVMLFDPAAHEPLVDAPWDEERVHGAVQAIVADAEAAFDPVDLWPVHPRDADYGGVDVYTTHGVWSGAAGVVWALHRLEELGAAQLSRSYADVAASLHAGYLRLAGGETPAVPSILVGEAGILLVAEVVAPGSGGERRLLSAIRENARNETNELLWGSPGTMLAACAMLERTGDERWHEAWEESADVLWERWEWDEELGCHLWQQELYGTVTRYLGPGHGFAGNVLALSRRAGGSRYAELAERAARTATSLAQRDDGLANWSPLAGGELRVNDTIRVQWCHGAPGIVSSLASLPGDDLREVLLEAGELTWRAGPLAKGHGLCHGTAGNGFALLALHRETGDERWLERARAFAMHALDQVDRSRAEHGGGRFSLWTGDLGAALFAWQCIDGDARFPTLEVW